MNITASNIWDRFEAMLARQAPALLASLRPPALQKEIAAAEAAMGLQLPEDVRDAYLRHDGTGKPLFPPFCYWASLKEMVDAHSRLVEYDASMRIDNPENYGPPNEYWDAQKVKPVGSSPMWLPIGLSNTSTSVYIDLDPAKQGTLGQLFKDSGMCEPSELAPSLGEFLEFLIDRVERGILIYRDWCWVWTETDEPAYDWQSMRKR